MDTTESSNRDLCSAPATYKKLTDSDIEQGLKEMNTKHDDVEDKMLPLEDKKGVKNEAEVKFISDEKKNGDAKVDIDDLRTAFVGMAKEELMRYANDPFWIRLRWILFILFWLVWLLMLFGAIGIIIAAPKCTAPEPRKWWEQGPLIEIDSEPNEDLLKQLKKENVQGLILPGNKDAYESPDFSFLNKILNIGLNVIVDLNPGSSNHWFNESEGRVANYSDYYIWADHKGNDASGQKAPPNNWKSPLGGSAWKYSDTRGQFYLAQLGGPTLNFRNEKVIDEFSQVLRLWLKAGAGGFRLSNIDRLIVDEQLRNEDIGPNVPPYPIDDYRFLTHKYTKDQPEIANVLSVWRKIIYNATDYHGVLTINENLDILQSYKLNDTLMIDLPSHSQVFHTQNKNITASYLYNGLRSAQTVLGKEYWPAWTIQPGELSEDVLQILTFTLPGTPIIKLSHNLSDTILPNLIALRASPAVLFGNFSTFLLKNDTVFAYTREKSGQPGYLIITNPTSSNITVDVTSIPSMSEDLTVSVVSTDYAIENIKPKTKVEAKAIPLSTKSALILTYVRADSS